MDLHQTLIALHDTLEALVTNEGAPPKPGDMFGRIHTGHDRFFPGAHYDRLTGRTTTPSAHETLSAMTERDKLYALFNHFRFLLRTACPLLGPKTHISIDCGLSKTDKALFVIKVDGLTSWGKHKPVLVKGAVERLELLINGLNHYRPEYAFEENLYHLTAIQATVSAPTPALAVLKYCILLRPHHATQPDLTSVGIGEVCLLLDKDRVMDDVAYAIREHTK